MYSPIPDIISDFSLDALPGGLFIYKADEKEEIIYANKEVLKIYGCETMDEFMELTQGTFKGMVFPADYNVVLGDINKQVNNKEGSFDHVTYRIQNKQGDILYIEDFGRLASSPNHGPVYTVFIVDIKNKQNSYIADPLTDLMGMRHFIDVLTAKREDDISRGIYDNKVILHFDINDFKRYNAQFGLEAGDELLKKIAEILKIVYPGAPISRFSSDYFVVCAENKDVIDKINLVHETVANLSTTFNINIQAGIRYITKEDEQRSVTSICDHAKIACDSIKGDRNLFYYVFDEKIIKDLHMKAYILENVDKAIENGYIHVYYQPVVRSLTGKLCGLEALTRWIDPTYGFLSPGVFIPLLEEAHLIHKLDKFVIEQVCRDLRYSLDNEIQVVPISFNLSRIDFLEGNPFETIEENVKKNNLRRELLRCEITESMIMADQEKMKGEILRLHKHGYEVWMDDFGSGYSTLSILKEFHFDEIKIDMMFLRNLNDEGRKIIKSIVTMAKSLGMHTLTEGAETEEHVEFLKSIGCERIQGYYFGKPMPYEELLQHCVDFGIMPETEAERIVFDKSGLVDVTTATPTAIVLDDSEVFTPLLTNDAYVDVMKTIGTTDMNALKNHLSTPNYSNLKKFRSLASKLKEVGDEAVLTTFEHGQYIKLVVKLLAWFENLSIVQVELYNITRDEDAENSKKLDALTRSAGSIFSEMYLWNIDEDYKEVIAATTTWEEVGEIIPDCRNHFIRFAQEHIYRDDVEEFIHFMDEERIYNYLKNSSDSYVDGMFRFRQPNGDFTWMTIVGVPLDNLPGRQMLLLLRDSNINDDGIRVATAKRLFSAEDFSIYNSEGQEWAKDSELWRNIVDNSSIFYFWKDKERRFLGASKAFLEVYGIEDINEILGKTDEDLGWHVDEELYKNDEISVIETGAHISDVIGSCVIKGQLRSITTNKFPMYQNGKIIGLIGYFRIIEEDEEERYHNVTFNDPKTGLLNFRGCMDSLLKFEEVYKKDNQNFMSMMIEIPEYQRIHKRCGTAISDKLIDKVAELVMKYVTRNAIVSRIGECKFMILDRMIHPENARDDIYKFAKEIHSISSIDGMPITINAHYTFAWRSEIQTVHELYPLLLKRLDNSINEDYASSFYTPERIVFDREKFDEMSECIYVTDPKTYDLYYINKKALSDVNLPADYDFTGKKCYEVVAGANKPCSFCPNARLRRERFYAWDFHNPLNSKDYLMNDTLIPWNGSLARFSFSVGVSDYNESLKEGQEFVYREMAINDAVEIAMQEDDMDLAIHKLLAKIGESLDAERAYIFEDMGNRVSSNTYEWCREGVSAEIDNLQNIPAESIKGFYNAFDRGEPIIINDLEEWKEKDKELYDILAPQNIHSLVAVQLKAGNKEYGYIGLDNPMMGNVNAISYMLSTLSHFVTFLLRNRDAMNQLDEIGTHDLLTGVMNRRGLNKYLETLHKEDYVAFVVGDINDLKEMNETLGHDKGDEHIKKCANVMKDVVGTHSVYRLGGDEFLITQPIQERSDADILLRKLRDAFEKEDINIALGCVTKHADFDSIEDVLRIANERMNVNKKRG